MAHQQLTEEFSGTAQRLQQSTVHVRTGRMGAGSGVIWRADGLIVTNAHVARTPRVQVELGDGREFDGEVVAIDPRRDLAAVKVQAGDLPAATVGDSDALKVGQLVVAVGNPLGLSGAMTVGIVHALAPSEERGHGTWVQADVRLAPGNSGGPLADVLGRVVGINSMVAGGLGLAVPSNDVEAFLRRDARRAFLGITTQAVAISPDGVRRAALLVLATEPDGPAARAGIWLGDVIVGVGGRLVRGPRDLATALSDLAPGASLTLQISRSGVQQSVGVTVGEPAFSPDVDQAAA